VLQGYHPLIYFQDGLHYYGLRKNLASFALCKRKEFTEEELGEFCSKIPKEEGEEIPSIQLRKSDVEWTISPNLIIRSFKLENAIYLYL